MTPPFVTSKILCSVKHGFFGKKGGVSGGIYASLNCGKGADNDPIDNVIENRARVQKVLGAEHLISCYQIHSAKVATVTEPWQEPPKADGMVTKTPNIALGILTADCTPVLFADTKAKVIGACHAGWQGAFNGVCEATINAMISLGADKQNINIGIGPCISQGNYQVGPEYYNRFIEQSADNAAFFTISDKPNHYQFNMPAYVMARLKAAGMTEVDYLDICTYAEKDDYFSYRRSTHMQELDYGRCISAITL